MITLHRLGHAELELLINPDLIVTIEANPDTVITLASGAKLVVAESPNRVAAAVRDYRVEVLAGALRTRADDTPRPRRSDTGALREAPGALREAPATLREAPATLREAPATLREAPAALHLAAAEVRL
jgi:flagellar protein FlbD